MRPLAWLMSLALATAPVAAEPGACVSSTGRSVSVHGAGTISLSPDRVSFTVGVETRNASVAEGYRANRARVGEVIAALKQKGVKADEMQTSYFEITTLVPQKGQPRLFKVESTVAVTRADPSSVGDLLQAAVSAGANQAGGLRFFVGDPAQTRRRGLELAFQDARSKAEALAALARKTLGDVLCIADETEYSDKEVLGRLRSLGYVGSGGFETGTEELAFNVSAVFELK